MQTFGSGVVKGNVKVQYYYISKMLWNDRVNRVWQNFTPAIDPRRMQDLVQGGHSRQESDGVTG